MNKCLVYLVGVTGLEPVSRQLNHARTPARIIMSFAELNQLFSANKVTGRPGRVRSCSLMIFSSPSRNQRAVFKSSSVPAC